MPSLYNFSSQFNPYMWDYIHPDGRFSAEYYDEISFYSNIAHYSNFLAAVLGGICSFLLLYLILVHATGPLQKYSRMLLLCSICDIVYWIVDTLVMPVSNSTIKTIHFMFMYCNSYFSEVPIK